MTLEITLFFFQAKLALNAEIASSKRILRISFRAWSLLSCQAVLPLGYLRTQ